MTLALLAQTLLDLQNIWLILALVFVQSGMFAVASSARGAIIPRIVPTELVPAANTLNFTVGNVGQVAGPLIAGLLLVLPNGFALAYAADALLFTAALYSVLRLPSIPPQGEVRRPDMRAVAEGLRFIAVRPVLVMSFAVDIAAMVLAMPRSLFPAVADDRFGGQVGPLYAAIAIGAVVAGLSSGWIGRVRRQGRALTLAIVGWGAAVAVSGLVGPAVAGRRPARPGRRVRPRQRGLPADHPPDLRARRDARSDAGGLHRRRRGRPPPRRRAGRRDRGRDQPDLLVGRRWGRLHGRRHRRGPPGPAVLALRHLARPALHGALSHPTTFSAPLRYFAGTPTRVSGMPVNEDFVGREYPPTQPYAVGSAKIREFAEAVGSTDPVHVDRAVAQARGYRDVIAPPTFAVLIAQQCDAQLVTDPEAGIDYSRVVHGEQKFVHHRPLTAGDDVVGVLHVDAVRAAGGNAMVTTRTELSVEGEAVCTAVSTLVIRGGE